jgi:hypothetical protein
MRKRALCAGDACAVVLATMGGCSLVAPLDGLTGNEPDAAREVDASTVLEASPRDSRTQDTTVVDTGSMEVDSGTVDLDAPVESGRVDAAADTSPTEAITFVQITTSCPANTVTSVTARFMDAQKAGDLNVVAIGWNDSTSTIASVVDTVGNTYTLAVGPTRFSPDLSQVLYYAPGIGAAAAGDNSVTVFFNDAANVVDLRVLEYSGLDPVSPLDRTATGTGNSDAPATAAALETTTAHELLFGAGMTTDGFTAGGTSFDMRVITSDGDIAEDRTVSATGEYTASAPIGKTGEWVMQLATFK